MADNGRTKLSRDRNGYPIQAAIPLTAQGLDFSADRVWNADQADIVRITTDQAVAYVEIGDGVQVPGAGSGMMLTAGQVQTVEIPMGYHIAATANINVMPWV